MLGKYPNTYGFTKGLCEQLVYEYKDKFPIAVARPTISEWLCDIDYSENVYNDEDPFDTSLTSIL